MLLDGLFATQAVDKSGEKLHIDGVDIKDYVKRIAPCDFEHAAERHAKANWREDMGSNRPGAADIVGQVIYAKRLMTEADCENDRQRQKWLEVGLPAIYGIVRLFDAEGHQGASEIAAMIRSAKTNGDPILVGWSIGGSTINREGDDLLETVARSVALTCRPCNASCTADILADQEAVAKSDRLGGWTTVETRSIEFPDDLAKTLAAGFATAAPGDLSGSAALQKEDLGKKLRLPHLAILTKDRGAEPDETAPAAPKAKKVTQRLTVLGQQTRATPAQEVRLDPKSGTLHTPRGAFKLYSPGDDPGYKRILEDPAVDKAHGRAMEGWTRAHDLMRQKKLPSEVVMHGVLFSQMSPSTPVPMQELMYSQLVDAMHQSGHDASRPGFEPTVDKWRKMNGALPQHARDHFAGNPAVHVQSTGLVRPHDKPAQKGDAIMRYHQMHDQLVDLVQRHGANARDAASEVLGHKVAENSHEDRRQRMVNKGQPDPGPYPGIKPYGLATKTTRYALGMMGGGDVTVPDTHFVRHVFGLDLNRDADTIDYLKSALWSPTNHHAMNALDEWYAQNHPAVKHMLQHPVWGKHFQRPQDAIFPAFWKHWMTILPHEKQRALPTKGHNELTTHAPYWDAVRPFMGKSEGSGDLPLHTALVHQQYQQAFGDVPASMLYASYLLPRLLDAAGQRVNLHGAAALLAGAHPQLERLSAELRGAADARTPSHGNDALWPGGPTVRKLSYDREGGKHAAGRVMTIDSQIVHLEDPHGLLAAVLPEGPLDARKTAILHGLENSSHVSVETDHDYLRDQPGLHPTLGKLPPPMDTGEPQFQPSEPDPTLPPPVDGVETYHYKRAGMDAPAVLEVSGDAAYLDGRPVPAALVRLMQANVRRGSASLVPAALAKAGEPPHPGMDRATTIQHVNAAVAAGHIHPDVAHALTRHLYEDPVTQGLGNQHAWGEFQRQNRPGVYIQLDGNGLKALNDTHGHAAGTAAIQHMGRALREATDEVKGRAGERATAFRTPDEHDLWRNGGDEFIAHVPSYGHAIRLVNAVRNKLDAVPPIGGTHRLSFAFGLGTDPKTADDAMYAAKDQKKTTGGAQRWAPGTVPHLGHSMIPGHQGPLNLHSEAPPPQATMEPRDLPGFPPERRRG